MTNEANSESTQPKVPQKEKKEKRSEKNNDKPMRWYNFRLFPIWLRIILVLLLLIIAGAAGLMIGFGVIGSGEPLDALKQETWQHMLDIINGKE
ncbi:DNA-directed RNA polymerase subunit beta [Ureibacillus aquaedulcis]|uniref:DNA-directed RNA polymerase subunit beta n=1 Tax=Ureibacillus aquaedulcis TaxID=3058421 RepID=A0ABT8GL50_9BACL|nr:DNA-directed RNA polymerase subunit beta [Ureibacillus sp. BA0131]MDN4492130.1 DNA-directed RNA polymerase subunit beta [Ureibacillus sp. BA0131]